MSVHGKGNLSNCKTEELLKTNLVHMIEKCDQCKDKFDDKRELEWHILSVHEEKKVYSCSTCKASYPDLDKMKLHIVSFLKKDHLHLQNCKPKELLRMTYIDCSPTCVRKTKQIASFSRNWHTWAELQMCQFKSGCACVLYTLYQTALCSYNFWFFHEWSVAKLAKLPNLLCSMTSTVNWKN